MHFDASSALMRNNPHPRVMGLTFWGTFFFMEKLSMPLILKLNLGEEHVGYSNQDLLYEKFTVGCSWQPIRFYQCILDVICKEDSIPFGHLAFNVF